MSKNCTNRNIYGTSGNQHDKQEWKEIGFRMS